VENVEVDEAVGFVEEEACCQDSECRKVVLIEEKKRWARAGDLSKAIVRRVRKMNATRTRTGVESGLLHHGREVRYYSKENLLWEIIEKATAVGPQYLPWRIDTEKKGCARHWLFESKGFQAHLDPCPFISSFRLSWNVEC
jgi:hypothetical protein